MLVSITVNRLPHLQAAFRVHENVILNGAIGVVSIAPAMSADVSGLRSSFDDRCSVIATEARAKQSGAPAWLLHRGQMGKSSRQGINDFSSIRRLWPDLIAFLPELKILQQRTGETVKARPERQLYRTEIMMPWREDFPSDLCARARQAHRLLARASVAITEQPYRQNST